jgi:hypothetical protein
MRLAGALWGPRTTLPKKPKDILNDSAAPFTTSLRRRQHAQCDESKSPHRNDDDDDDDGGVTGVDNTVPASREKQLCIPLSSSSSSPSSSRGRRWVVSSIAVSALLLSSSVLLANAAPPLTADTVDGISARFKRAILRPRPDGVLQLWLNIDFAILLMRSSYNALDALDVVPMEQFQRDFFLFRQAEYGTYADYLVVGVMQQGDLTDPVSDTFTHVTI